MTKAFKSVRKEKYRNTQKIKHRANRKFMRHQNIKVGGVGKILPSMVPEQLTCILKL